MDVLDSILKGLLDFIYPFNLSCIVCQKPIRKDQPYSLCEECMGKIEFIGEHTCQKCGKPLDSLYVPSECPDCIKDHHYFDHAASCVVYDDLVKKMIYGLKYKDHRYMVHSIGKIMLNQWKKQHLHVDVMVPVPMDNKKKRKRGFNQAQLLTQYMSKQTQIPMCKDLVKIKETKEQHQLLKQDRMNNLKNVFKVIKRESFLRQNILLIDDVYTTGATVDACSKELLKCDPKKIYILTFATGKNT